MASADQTSPAESRSSWPPRFQFSLKTLLIVATVVAVVLGIGGLLPALLRSLLGAVLLVVVVPGLLVTSVYARGPPQAFAQGVLGTTVVWQAMAPTDTLSKTLAWLLLSVVSGMVAIFVREWIRLHGWDQPD